MALIKCQECGKEISDKSENCIHCGCPVEVKVESITKETTTEVVNKPKKNNNKLIVGILVGVIVLVGEFFIINYMTKVEIPDLYGVSEDNASLILTSKSLVPQFIYEYNDLDEGLIYDTNPSMYDRVDNNSIVTVYVSKGPSYIQSTESTINWYHVGSAEDDWDFYNPHIKEGYLYIECQPTFGTSFKWKESGFGTASINDTFAKKVPLKIEYNNQEVKANEQQEITLVIPVKDLDVNKPTTLYTKLSIEKNNVYQEISVNFTISW